MAPYRSKPSRDGNALFAKLPPEVRCKIWCLLVVKHNGAVFPVLIPTYSATERFVCMDWSQNVANVTLQLDAIMQTCKLFYNDQKVHLLFYKHNHFRFRGSRDCLTYVASITPSRRQAIRHIIISMDPDPFLPGSVKDEKPSERLLAIASLCPGLQSFRNSNFFFGAESLTHWAIILSRFLENFVSQLPLLKDLAFGGGNGGRTLVFGFMARSLNFYWETLDENMIDWKRERGSFSIRGEEALTAVWKQLSDRKRPASLPLPRSRLRAAIAATPILTRGEERGMLKESNAGERHDDGCVSSAPDRIFDKGLPIRGFRIHSHASSPRLYICGKWYDWNEVFHSEKMSEAESKRCLQVVVEKFTKKYGSWVYLKRASKGKRHGDWRAQVKMINAIWGLKWQDRKAKLEVLKKLYKSSRTRRCRFYF
ncbi:hypothetical protein CCMA1212_007279 [Trichoderma ghanense]|uniref:Uncharacterized protein n=1 Tax=Trichoderma ghanense TaxID=65468 RepID=A0ABY2GX89_9HYPO